MSPPPLSLPLFIFFRQAHFSSYFLHAAGRRFGEPGYLTLTGREVVLPSCPFFPLFFLSGVPFFFFFIPSGSDWL